MTRRAATFLLGLTGLVLIASSQAATPGQAAVASAHPLATQAGHEILKKGGNAFDAAIAITAAIGVVEPTGSGIGGGGFWLLHRARDNYQVMIDGREVAPLAATADMYLDKQGNARRRASLDGPLAAAIPGVPAALVHLAEKYGRLPLQISLAPAIRYARQGFAVTEHYRRMATLRQQALMKSDAAAEVFLNNGGVPALGHKIKQPDLAFTLRQIARHGRAGFYQGALAEKMVRGVKGAGGIWTLKDLQGYRVKERTPITGRYHGMRITSAAPPSSGGIILMQMLNILEGFKLDRYPSWQRKHLVIETMRQAYRDRAQYLGDTDFVAVDIGRLTDKVYATRKRALINPNKATPSQDLPGFKTNEGQDTTHFSVMDKDGNAVAATLSINYPFGSAFMPAGTGIILNNEMDDFVIKPGVPNVYGLVGGKANAIQPGKRPLSSMTPTFLETDDQFIALGTPGGSRIITMVLLATLEAAHGKGDIKDWVALPRYHHQYLPDRVVYESAAFTDKEVEKLQNMGHILKARKSTYGERSSYYGNMHAVVWDKRKNKVSAASDPRGEGEARVR
ncbi:MAG: gamma-glutamyltransferase [Gammaproteobacteria bacterium]|nr:MAG: gamma-glutamyltransferase [Gammaproteobacteria bacterium]